MLQDFAECLNNITIRSNQSEFALHAFDFQYPQLLSACVVNSETVQVLKEHRKQELSKRQQHIRYDSQFW